MENCPVVPEYIELFTAALAKREKSVDLSFMSIKFGARGALAFASLLGVNPPIKGLSFEACDVDSAGCCAMLEALNGNTHLRHLDWYSYKKFLSRHISKTAAIAIGNSRLDCLAWHGAAFDNESIDRLVEGLKTNCFLKTLAVPLTTEYQVESVVRLLSTYNFTLNVVDVDDNDNYDEEGYRSETWQQYNINELVRINASVRHVHNNLENCSYHLGKRTLWPQALERISSKPSLLYRCLRRGNLN